MTLYSVKRPDGTLVEMQPQIDAHGAYASAARIEGAEKGGNELVSGRSLRATTWRAAGRCIDYPGFDLAAAEIAPLMGYVAVEVVCVEKEKAS